MQALGELPGERRQAWVDWVKQYRAALQARSLCCIFPPNRLLFRTV